MHKSATLPSTSREWRASAASSPAMCAVVATHERRRLRAQSHHTTTTPLGVHEASSASARCGSHSVQRACSTACVTRAAVSTALVAANTSAPHNTPDSEVLQHYSRSKLDSSRVHVGWLCMETSASKRSFTWRYCVLDGARLSLFRDSDSASQGGEVAAQCLGRYLLIAVERLHCINRGLVVTDSAQHRIWAHADHETASFEAWLHALRTGIAYERMRRDGSIFERPYASLSLSVCSRSTSRNTIEQQQQQQRSREGVHCRDASAECADASFTDWLLMRRRVLCVRWLFSKAVRMYCVLSGSHFAAFSVNREGKWANVHGRITAVRVHTSGYWLELNLERSGRVRLAGKTHTITTEWLQRMCHALTCEMEVTKSRK